LVAIGSKAVAHAVLTGFIKRRQFARYQSPRATVARTLYFKATEWVWQIG